MAVGQKSKGLFINDVINFGGYRDPPPSPSSSFVTFWLPPLIARVTCDKTAYVVFMTIVEGLSQPKSNIQGVFWLGPPPQKKIGGVDGQKLK